MGQIILVKQTPWQISFYLILILLFTFSACSVRLIADYDETTDNEVTQLQKKVDTFLISLERMIGVDNEAAYSKNTKFYDEIRVDLSAIQVRAKARVNNEITLRQIEEIKKSLDALEQLHRLGFQKVEEIKPLRDAFNESFSAILKLELAKKKK